MTDGGRLLISLLVYIVIVFNQGQGPSSSFFGVYFRFGSLLYPYFGIHRHSRTHKINLKKNIWFKSLTSNVNPLLFFINPILFTQYFVTTKVYVPKCCSVDSGGPCFDSIFWVLAFVGRGIFLPKFGKKCLNEWRSRSI